VAVRAVARRFNTIAVGYFGLEGGPAKLTTPIIQQSIFFDEV
jgi:hypothetical protein